MSSAHEYIEILVNGERKNVTGDLSLNGLLQQLGVERDRVAVELNKKIVRKPDWASTCVSQGAEIEIVQFVGGG